MEKKRKIAALFDFDGVVMDTESQYSVFWKEQGQKYLGMDDLNHRVKGTTLAQIFNKFFDGMDEAQRRITADLDQYESEMNFEYLPGVEDFLADLKKNGVKIALVTSSDKLKMKKVYARHPDFQHWFDRILTAECFTHCKPDPECFLLGMKIFGTAPGDTYVFEDSFNGLKAGMDSGAQVIGLATTNSREAIAGKAHHIIDDFNGMTFEKLCLL